VQPFESNSLKAAEGPRMMGVDGVAGSKGMGEAVWKE